MGFGGVRITLLRPTPVLRLARMAELWIRAVLEQQIGPGLVEEHAAEPIAEPRGSQPRRIAAGTGCWSC
jgi:hypothetical protein